MRQSSGPSQSALMTKADFQQLLHPKLSLKLVAACAVYFIVLPQLSAAASQESQARHRSSPAA